jgi:hypothetical protein
MRAELIEKSPGEKQRFWNRYINRLPRTVLNILCPAYAYRRSPGFRKEIKKKACLNPMISPSLKITFASKEANATLLRARAC